MKLIRTAIPDILIIEPVVFHDERGWFMESFNEDRFNQELTLLGVSLPGPFVQDNHSSSEKGVLRGLHYQINPHAQGKLVRVVTGSVFDVAVDIREDSPTYLKWVGVELTSVNKKMLWIPKGFAHGFVALEDNTQFLYKTTDYYNKSAERSLLWCDKDIAIQWPDLGKFNISEKDMSAPDIITSLNVKF